MKGIRRIICAVLVLVFLVGLVPMDASVAAAGTGQLGEAVIKGNRDFKWPVPDYHNISACFFDGRDHYAIDIGTITTNADIVASYDGEVVEITRNGAGDYGYGNAVMLRHTYPASSGTITLYSRYAHMSEISEGLSVGSVVVGGETVLGKTGGSGYGSANYYSVHLDFQILTSDDWLNRQTCSIDPFVNNLMELPADIYLGRTSDCCQSYIDAIKALYAGDAHTHSYEKTVIPPSCTEDGYTTYTCSCGDEYTDETVTKLGHSWQEEVCGETKTCSVCGATEGTVEHTEINGACSACGAISVSETNFPDAAFREYVSKNFIAASDGWLTENELKAVTTIYVGTHGISSLKGIEFFTSLEYLRCEKNSLTELDVSKNTKLKSLECYVNSLTELDISNNTELEYLSCSTNALTTLDLSNNSKLGMLSCGENELTQINLRGCPELWSLHCASNQLTSLDLSACPKVRDLDCTNNKLTTLDVSVCRELWILKCSKNQLVSLNTGGCKSLDNLDCSNNVLTSLDLSTNTLISKLNVQYNTRVVTAEGNKFDLSTLPGFDVSKVVEVVDGTLEGNILTAEDAVVEYYYDCGNDVTASFVLVMENLCEHQWIDANCTEAKRCYFCGVTDGEALGHDMGEWVTTDEPTCTVDGSKRKDCSRCDHFETDVIPATGHSHEATVTPPTCTEDGYTTYTCACGDTYTDDEVTALGHDMSDWVTTEDASCTADGSKRKDCSRCDHFETEVIPADHDMGEWETVTEATPENDGEERRDCSRCDHFETRVTRFVDNMLKLEGEDFLDKTTVYINGLPYPVVVSGEERYVELPTEEDCSLVTYTYHVDDPNDIHTQYPVGMRVYMVSGGEISYIEELDNLLQYSGTSIRITGKKGIRMISSLYKDTKSALTGNGLAGYKLVEYGTVLAFAYEVAGDGDLVLGRSYSRSNYAYKRGVTDPVFANKGNLTQYTNVLVGFNLDQCREDIAMRSYIILEDADGEQITLYGGTIYRSIGYVAYRNRNAFQPKTAAYNYVWEIIHHVYGNQYDSDYRG